MCCGQLDWHLHQAPPLRRTGSWTKDRPGQIDNSPLLEDWPWHNFWGQTGCLARFIPCFFLPLFLPFSHLQLLTSASWFHVLRIFCRKGGGAKMAGIDIWYIDVFFIHVSWWFLAFMALMALQENSSTAIKKTLDQLNDYRIISEDGQSRYGHRAVLSSTLHGSNTLTAVCCILPMVCNMYIHVYHK